MGRQLVVSGLPISVGAITHDGPHLEPDDGQECPSLSLDPPMSWD
jgi:hypothetical protein